MKKIVVGIDVSMDELVVCIKQRENEERTVIKGTGKFNNNQKGFAKFKEWYAKRKKEGYSFLFVMEATGVYYENLAYFLHSEGESVHVVLANKIKNFAKSLNVKTKTDSVDAKTISDFGLERKIERWEPMSPVYLELRDLCRERLSVAKDIGRAKNQLHAMAASSHKLKKVVEIKKEQIVLLEDMKDVLEEEIRQVAQKDNDLSEKIEKLQTIPAVSFMLAVTLVSETNGFRLVHNIRQLVSYAGLDVILNESGKFKGKTRISKKGNSRIRQVLYMPAMSAVQCNESITKLHKRICERNPDLKRKGVIAAMRKLLILSYTLWKKDESFDKEYAWN